MKLEIEIESLNAAFDESPKEEAIRILQQAIAKIANCQDDTLMCLLRDSNGNAVGRMEMDVE